MRTPLLLTTLLLLTAACDEASAALDPVDTTVDADGDGVADGEDCDDTDAAISPLAEDICDGVDNDCDGEVDNGADGETFYADADGDGFGDADAAVTACAQPDGHVSDATDCDDRAAGRFPGAEESCDGVDNDCDGEVDDGVGETFYADADGDGFGAADAAATACAAPDGHVTDATDCDDSAADVYPGAADLCDGVDNDCNGAEPAVASFVDDSGVWSDMTAALSGAADAPAEVTLDTAGTLYVCAGTWHTTLTVAADVDIVGPYGAASTVLSGGGVDSVVRVETGKIAVGLEGLTLTEGLGTASMEGTSLAAGGGLHCSADADLTVTGLHFLDNVAVNGAGAALSGGCDAAISESTFEGGSASYGGGVTVIYSTMTLADVDFLDNDASSSGAGIRLASVGELLVSGGTFSGNSAPRGGGIYNNGGILAVDDATFDANTASAYGGAVYSKGTDRFTDVVFSDNLAFLGLGAYVGVGNTLSVTDGSFEGNVSVDGGAMGLDGATATITGTTFSDNEASDEGGALILYDDASLAISDATFSDNAAASGGGICLIAGEIVGEGVSFSDNEPDDLYTEGGGGETLGAEADFACDDDGC